MSMIETVNDVSNSFLSRREITCYFRGLAGKLKKSEAVEMITKEFKLDGKAVIAINLKNDTGRPHILGTFYVYDDENLAKKQVNPVIFERLEKQKKKDEEAEKSAEEAKADAQYYKIDGEKFTRSKKICSRCGKGVYMSEHKNRRTCGKCGNTEFIQ